MFKLIHNRKGLSLIELIITVAIIGLVLALSSRIFFLFHNTHESASNRWQVQNAVRLASAKFETNSNLIINSKQVDIFYDEAIAEGINYNRETGTWSWKKTPSVLPDATQYPQGNDYTYMYSTPAYDGETFIGYLLFIRNDSTHAETNSVLFLNNEGFGEVPVQVEFSVGTNKLDKIQNQDISYQDNSTHVYFKSGNASVTSYETDTIYVSENLAETKSIGHENGQLIYDSSWLGDSSVATAYPCGWVEGVSVAGYPSDLGVYSGTEKTPESLVYTYENEQIQKTGNVLRFLSPLSDKSFEKGSGSATSEKPTCLNQWLFDDMSSLSERVLDNLRNFRDKVLRGTEFGDWFIHEYYYTWSPSLIKYTAFLEPVYKAVLIPLSYVCDFIADL